jgi:hypothetical protein
MCSVTAFTRAAAVVDHLSSWADCDFSADLSSAGITDLRFGVLGQPAGIRGY